MAQCKATRKNNPEQFANTGVLVMNCTLDEGHGTKKVDGRATSGRHLDCNEIYWK